VDHETITLEGQHLEHLGLDLRTGGEWENRVRREYKGVSSPSSVYL